MTDIKTEVSQVAASAQSAVTSAVSDAKQTASAFEQKQAGWVRRNWVAILIGLVLGAIVGHIL